METQGTQQTARQHTENEANEKSQRRPREKIHVFVRFTWIPSDVCVAVAAARHPCLLYKLREIFFFSLPTRTNFIRIRKIEQKKKTPRTYVQWMKHDEQRTYTEFAWATNKKKASSKIKRVIINLIRCEPMINVSELVRRSFRTPDTRCDFPFIPNHSFILPSMCCIIFWPRIITIAFLLSDKQTASTRDDVL